MKVGPKLLWFRSVDPAFSRWPTPHRQLLGSLRAAHLYLDVPLEKRQGLPSKVILPIAKVKAMIETWRNEANKNESFECNRSVIMLGEMD